MKIYVEHETKHSRQFGRRVFRVAHGAIDYAYVKDVAENYDRARWYGFHKNAEMPPVVEVCSLGTAAALGA